MNQPPNQPLPSPPTLKPHHQPANMPVTSTSAYAPRRQQHSLEPSNAVRNLPPSRGSRQHLSNIICRDPLPPTRDICADTDPTPPQHEISKSILLQRVPRLTKCSHNKKFAPCRMFFASPHSPTTSREQCTPTSRVHSLSARSKVCSISSLHMFMISTQSSCEQCHLAQMHPW